MRFARTLVVLPHLVVQTATLASLLHCGDSSGDSSGNVTPCYTASGYYLEAGAYDTSR